MRRHKQSVKLLYCTCAEAQPDEATLRQILSNSTVMEGFEDPAVMAAVAEIAQDPATFSQHAEDAKVSCTASSLSERALQTTSLLKQG